MQWWSPLTDASQEGRSYVTQAQRKDGQPTVYVAAFGKHPGWDDHIEEIGLDTELLVNAKRVLYTECIGGCIDAGDWEKLEGKAIPFAHNFYWRSPAGLLVGRMWASRDGKGRTKYPMVVCAMVDDAPTGWAITQILPRLAAVEDKCGQTLSAEMVRLAIGEFLESLKAAAASMPRSSDLQEASGPLLSRLLQSPVLTRDNRQGMVRVLYEMGRELLEFRPTGMTAIKPRTFVPACQHLRVPKGLDAPGEGARAWMALLDQEITHSAPVLVLEPQGQRFLDIIVGEPKAKSFVCARSGEDAIALTSDVPYSMDLTDVKSAESKIDAWIQGRASTGGELVAPPKPSSPGNSNLKLILLGVAGILLVIVVIVLSRGGKKEAPAGGAQRAPELESPAVPQPTKTAKAEGPVATPAQAPRAAPAPPPAANSGDPADPRTSWGYDETVRRVTTELDAVDRDLAAEKLPMLSAARENLADIAQHAAIVRATPWRQGSRDQIVSDIAAVDGQIAEVELEVKKAQDAVAGRVGAALLRRQQTSPVKSRVLVSAWASGLGGIDTHAGRQAAEVKANALERALKAAETGIEAVPPLDAAGVPLVDPSVVAASAESRRDEALRAAADAALAGDEQGVAKAVEGLRAWNRQATEVLAAARQLNAPSPSGRTPQELEAAIRESPSFRDLSGALSPLLQQTQALQSINTEEKPQALVDIIQTATATPKGERAAPAVAAWSRLAAIGWPSTPEDMISAGALRAGPLSNAISQVPDAAGRGQLEADAAAASAAMWQRFAIKHATDQPGCAAIRASQQSLSVPATAEGQLPAWAQYNLARHRLEEAVIPENAKAMAGKPGERSAAVAKFVQAADALGPQFIARAEPAALLAQLRPFADLASDLDASKMGPGAHGWQAAPSKTDGSIVFTLNQNGHSTAVTFERLPGEGDIAYLSTAEVTVGAFADAITKAAAWEEVRPELAKFTSGEDSRRGPRVWEWSTQPGEEMIVATPGKGDTSSGWLRVKPTMAGVSYYPAGLSVPPPTRDHPMQFVSPTAAMLMARTVGCRLPTREEWTKAVDKAPSNAQNLRDATWRKQYEHTKAVISSQPDYPASGIFWPAKAQKIPTMQDGFAAVEQDDGILWFVPAPAGPGFHHLIGNVAEFVWDDPAAIEGLEPVGATVKAALGKGENLKVIGGSALSPKEVPIREAQAVNFSAAREGYSDVGFRLAFTVPRGAVGGSQAKIEQALRSTAYLKPEAK